MQSGRILSVFQLTLYQGLSKSDIILRMFTTFAMSSVSCLTMGDTRRPYYRTQTYLLTCYPDLNEALRIEPRSSYSATKIYAT